MRVAILAFPRFQLLDVAGPADVFAEACRQLGQPNAYQVQVLSTQSGMLASSSGLLMAVDASIESHKGAIDTLLVATDFGPGTLTESGYPFIVKRL